MNVWKSIFLALLVFSLMSCATAKMSMMDPSGANPVVEVVKNVREAVVQIKVESRVTNQNNINPFFDDPFFAVHGTGEDRCRNQRESEQSVLKRFHFITPL